MINVFFREWEEMGATIAEDPECPEVIMKLVTPDLKCFIYLFVHYFSSEVNAKPAQSPVRPGRDQSGRAEGSGGAKSVV